MAFLVGLIVTALMVPLVIRLSPTLGLVDQPGSDPLKIHQRPIPRSGGLALAAGLALSAFVVRPNLGWVIGGMGALVLGLIDDRTDLSPRSRFLAEVLLAFITSAVLVDTAGWLPVILGSFVIVVAINASNLFDGLDGLLPGTGLLTAIGLAFLLVGSARLWMLALAGCLLGFLVHNRPPARVFLGDGGAYLVGMTLGIGLLELTSSGSKFLGGVVAFGLIGGDFVVTLLRRWRKRRPLFIGDRSHLYDQLVDRSWSVWRTLLVVWGVHAGLVAIGITVARLRPPVAAVAVGLTFGVSLILVWRLGFIGSGPTALAE